VRDLILGLVLAIIIVLLVVIAIFAVGANNGESRVIVEKVVEESIIEVPSEFSYYRGLELNEEVIKIAESGGTNKLWDFFTIFTENREITQVIFEESLALEVPIVSAFALAWGESRYKPQRINRNINSRKVVISTDWGLYQLNDAHRKWTKEDFFNIRKNTHEGLSFFKHVLETFNGELVLSYGGYNKGINGLKSGDIPFITIVHANNIIEYEREMEIKLNYFINRWKFKYRYLKEWNPKNE
jgi:hypothetical protein